MRPQPQEIYRHFKDKLYQILTIAKHSETGEELVIYQALYGDFAVYARPLSMFVGEVDKEKYPDVKQKYRFEKVENSNQISVSIQSTDVSENNEEEMINKDLLAFLDAKTYEEKRNLLVHMKDRMDDKLIDGIAASMDVTVDDGELDTRYRSLLNCVETMHKFEYNRI